MINKKEIITKNLKKDLSSAINTDKKVIAYSVIFEEEINGKTKASVIGVMPKEINSLIELMVSGALLKEEYEIIQTINRFGINRLISSMDKEVKSSDPEKLPIVDKDSKPEIIED